MRDPPRTVGLELEQPLVHVAEVADLEVGVVDPAGVVVVPVDGELVERLSETRVRGLDSCEDRARGVLGSFSKSPPS